MGPRPKLNFLEYGHVAYQIKADDAGSNMVANILPTDTPSTQGVGSKGQTIFFFSERSQVAYQIKADEAGSNIVANILPTQGVRSKGQTISFYEVVMLHIKLKGIEHRAPRKQIYYAVITHTNDPCGGVTRSFFFLF